MKAWHTLKANDTVDIIAPSYKFPEHYLPKIADYLAQWQLKTHVAPNIFGDDLLCANSDEKRFQHLLAALTNPNSQAIFCGAGGYGCARLIPYLEKITPPPIKVFVGLSDITALHLFFQKQWGWITIHGPAIRQALPEHSVPVTKESLDALRKLIFGETPIVRFMAEPLNEAARTQKVITTSVTGGNLCLVQTSMGTSWECDSRNKIILLEDVKEQAYSVDRMLNHLKQAGLFQHAAAVMLGDFTVTDACESVLIDKVLQRFADQCAIPVIRCRGIGHDVVNFPIPLGAPTELHLGDTVSIHCEAGCQI